jgi:hypothetical protein
MNRTERIEEPLIEEALYKESHQEPRYPIIERPEVAQLGNTIIRFTQYDSEGAYIEVHDAQA